MNKTNHYIATIIPGKRVIFTSNDQVYIKKYREKNKKRMKEYVTAESVNITCNNLDDNFVIIESNSHIFYNKIVLNLIFTGMILSLLLAMIMSYFYTVPEPHFYIYKRLTIVFIITFFVLMFSLIIYVLYVALFQTKKIYKNYTQTVEGEMIDYKRIEHQHRVEDTTHCDYYMMYKYKLPNGDIIHSVVSNYSANLLYKDYPLGKKIMIKYNPNMPCESCLLDEYESIFKNHAFLKNSVFNIEAIAKVTNIKTICIDEEMPEFLKPYNLVDYIECEYQVNQVLYKTYSKFAVPHQRFSIGDELIIFIEYTNIQSFYCDIPKKFSNLDPYDY